MLSLMFGKRACHKYRFIRQSVPRNPHIAGYSADGKANATRMSLDALCRYFNIQTDYQIIPPAPKQLQITGDDLSDAYLQMYDPAGTATH